MLSGHKKRVSGEQGTNVKEPQYLLFVEDYVGGDVSGDDLTEDAHRPKTKCADTVGTKRAQTDARLRRRSRVEEEKVRAHAEAHAAANVAGDMARAASDLTDDARANIGPVARRLPRPITSGRVTKVEQQSADRFLAEIEYSGADGPVMVESVWVEQGGKPMIAETRIV
jgi:hypothetical protein